VSISLQTFRQMALDAMQHDPSGDTVIRLDSDKTGLRAHKWTPLGQRSSAEKHDNLAVRQALVQAFKNEVGDLKFNKKLEDTLKIYDFKINDNGEVTSKRPLTARRIIALTDMINNLSEAEKDSFSKLNEKTKGWGGNIRITDKITLAKELAKPESKEFQGLTKLKMHHALIGLDTLSKLRENPPKLMKFGAPLTRLKAFAKQIGERVGSSFRDICNESNNYINEQKLAEAENRPSNAVKTKNIERFGEHDYGGDDVISIMRSVVMVLLAENQDLKELCDSLDKKAFNTMMEDFSVNDLDQADQKAAYADADFQTAEENYLDVKEGRKAGDLDALKAKLDTAEVKYAQCAKNRNALMAEADVYSTIARIISGGKAVFDDI